jgi:hypothetical protein
LAQTTTSQTIIKHIGGKCRFCPPEIRDWVAMTQHQHEGKGRPRYGSRKIFFQRVWARLHGGTVPEAEIEQTLPTYGHVPGFSDPTAAVSAEAAAAALPPIGEVDEEVAAEGGEGKEPKKGPLKKRKNRFGALPTQRNKRGGRKLTASMCSESAAV